jgi:hypothetical protein
MRNSSLAFNFIFVIVALRVIIAGIALHFIVTIIVWAVDLNISHKTIAITYQQR